MGLVIVIINNFVYLWGSPAKLIDVYRIQWGNNVAAKSS